MYDGWTSRVSQELAVLRRLLVDRLKAEGKLRVYDPVRNAPTVVSFKPRITVKPVFCPSPDLDARLEEDHRVFGDMVLGILVRVQSNGHVEEQWYEIASSDAIQDAALLRMLASVPDG